ncbi:MAG: 50S ribosomal protein L11 methyltransferase [Proteobacteria bacterium]|nr:50S ribosomal protein L11 methyltransferase [Pseudomonadota bacterium]
MPFEITIEGPYAAISRFYANLSPYSPAVRKIPARNDENRERGRIIIVESNEDCLDNKLLDISRIVEETKRVSSLRSEFDFRVRNLAYSEPSSGSSQFVEPFNPIPSITIQPWTPDLTWPADPRTIILDPHHAFGTGKHPTTRLCLRIMDLLANGTSRAQGINGVRVLDFGCGTGLLAIAAIKMGAQEAVGVEIDPASGLAARNNVDLNHLSGRITIREGSWEAVHERYEIILANLVVSALLKTGTHIRDHLTPNGTAVISGFGENQAGEVRCLFEQAGLTLWNQYALEGWAAALLLGGAG